MSVERVSRTRKIAQNSREVEIYSVVFLFFRSRRSQTTCDIFTLLFKCGKRDSALGDRRQLSHWTRFTLKRSHERSHAVIDTLNCNTNFFSMFLLLLAGDWLEAGLICVCVCVWVIWAIIPYAQMTKPTGSIKSNPNIRNMRAAACFKSFVRDFTWERTFSQFSYIYMLRAFSRAVGQRCCDISWS